MTTAFEIMQTARNANDAMDSAAEKTTDIDQDWENEATIYIFDDESALVVSGPDVSAYKSKSDAIAAISA